MTNLLKKVLLMLAITVIIFSLVSCQLLDMLPDELVEKIPGLGGDDHEHVFSDATCTTPATCECGETEGEALGHSFVDGKCACGEEDPDYVPHEHSYVDGKCECGAEDPNYVPPHVHNYEAVVTAPTCTEAGYTTYTCACGDSYEADKTAALGHTYEAVVTAPTCTEAGYTTNVCSCGDQKVIERTPALGHTYEADVTAPTCTEAGYTTFTCACGDSYKGANVAALGHSHSAIVTAPTCTEAGYTTYVCACGDSYVADETDVIAHDYIEGICSVCGAEDPNYCAHEYEENFWAHPELEAATCCTPGTGVMQCVHCGDYYTFEIEIDPYGHEWDYVNSEIITAPDCSTMTDGVIKVTCTLCGASEEQVEYVFHTYENEEYVFATCTTDGSYYACCSVCGYEESYVIEAGGHFNWYLECGQTGACMECGEEYTKNHEYFEDACAPMCVNCGAISPDAPGHNYVNGFCAVCYTPNLGYTDTIEVPETPTLEYLEGIWYGYEYDADYNYYTFVITLGADGKGTVSHSELGEFNVTYTGVYSGYIMMVTNNTPTLYLVYSEGMFTLRTESEFDTSMTYGTSLEMYKIAGKNEPAEHEHNFVDGKCECGETDPNYNAPVEAPAELTEEYLVGTWYGTEVDWQGNTYTFTIVFDEYGKGTVTHSSLGEFRVSSILDGGDLIHLMFDFGTYQTSLDYSNGVLTLMDGMKNFTSGRETMIMSKTAPEAPHEHEFVDGKCECGEEDPNYVPPVEIPAELTEEYLVGTWYGTEIDWEGNTHTFTIVFDEYGNGTVTHSSLGEFRVSSILDGGDLIHLMFDFGTYQTSLDYSNGVLTLMDGMKNFTSGRETMIMSKTAPETPEIPHEHEFVDGKCECGEEDPNYVPPVVPEYPEVLDYDYLTGTWTGTETDWKGNTQTFTIVFDGQMGTVTHSSLGTFGVMVEISYGMIFAYPECEFDYSIWMYSEGVIYLMDGMNSFSGGDVLAMTKGEAEEPAPAPHEHTFMYACDAHCMECGELVNENAAHSITLVKGTPATCTVDGKADVYACEICGYGWLDEELTVIANPMSIVIFATGHSYMFECDATCMVCGELTNENAAHSIALVPGTPATCTVDGKADVYACEICGYGWLDEELTIIANPMSIVIFAPGHDFDAANCTSPKTCAICDETEGEALGHADDNGDFKCDRCSTKMLPADGTALTIPQALAIAELAGTSYTTQKYYITGIVTNLYNTQYGNFYIKDDAGNEICIYGLYSADGNTRYDAMSYKPVEGDEVTVYTVLGMYSTTKQGKNAWLDEVVAHTHDYSESVTAPTCTAAGYTTYTCSICKNAYTADETEALGHTTENGTCDNCGLTIGGSEPVIGTLATFTFGANGSASHVDPNTKFSNGKSYTVNGYALTFSSATNCYDGGRDAKGNSCMKMGTSSKTGSFTVTVADDVTEVVIYVAQYKANATKISVNGGAAQSITTASNNGEYTAIVIDTSVNKTFTFATVSGGVRCMIDTIEFKGQVA